MHFFLQRTHLQAKKTNLKPRSLHFLGREHIYKGERKTISNRIMMSFGSSSTKQVLHLTTKQLNFAKNDY